MKTFALLPTALIGLMLAIAAPAQATAPCPTKWTADGFVALRKRPGVGFKRVKKLYYPTAVDIMTTGHTATWLKVWVNNSSGVPAWQGCVRKSLIDLNSCG